MTDAELIEAARAAALKAYALLSREAWQQSLVRWNQVNKHHFAWHVSACATYLNPTLTWTYPYEDLVGRAQRAAMQCAKATPMIKLANAFMLRYRKVVQVSMASV